ncbi:unnamed protein product, partial [Schistosoma curassoni]|uniref:CXC domain-containing protein n=1 Tax=Schistosoma curassoni TaxID=6186 RepID=A0A183KG70_9TREM
SKSNADSHTRRCKCRETCQARCSCRRSGRPCVPLRCYCVSGLCKNRSDSSSQNSQIVSSVENPATVMGPPSGFPVILRPKRKTQNNDNDDLPSPTDNSQLSDGGSLRYLWPKNRLSYFPSPLLRSDR